MVISPIPEGTAPVRTGQAEGMRLLYAGAAITGCMVGIYLIRDIVAPVFLAITLVLTVRPLATWLSRHRVPRVVSGFIALFTVYAVLGLIVLAIVFALSQFIQAVPQFTGEAQAEYSKVSSWLTSLGVSQEAIAQFLSTFDFTRLIGLATGLFGQITGGATFILTLFLFVAFIAVDLIDVTERSNVLTAVRPNLAAALSDFSWRVRQYWVVMTIFGVAVALINMGILFWLQIPLVLTWGILAFVTAYIPNVGFIIGMVPPAIMALLARGWQTMVIMVAAYVVVNFIASMIIQPKVTGDAVGLNVSATFASLLLWGVIIGPMGAILAVPLTLFFKCVLFDSEPRTRWISVFLGGNVDGLAAAAVIPSTEPGLPGALAVASAELPNVPPDAGATHQAHGDSQANRPPLPDSDDPPAAPDFPPDTGPQPGRGPLPDEGPQPQDPV